MAKMKGFKWVQTILSIIIMPIGFVIWGLAASPGILLFLEMSNMTMDWVNWQRAIVLGITLGIGALLWCIIDLIIVGILGMIIRPKLDDAREPTESMLTIRWGVFSVFHRLAQPSLKWMVPSFVGNIYYSMMGCKVGRGAQINSSFVNDCFMVEIGDRTIIGGDATINGHLFERDGIHLSKVKIGKKVVIGAGSQINPGCVIGDGSVVASRAVLPKFTNIPPKEIWGGIPAKFIKKIEK
jgi:acetyltransferase-like isoleucine patch superfamily enzyme|tara:strand:- start:5625 stop:6341 length:717 start_codon:yes stop_codon:yes gene_type:complete